MATAEGATVRTDLPARLVESEQVAAVAFGYYLGAALMIGAGAVEWWLGVDAENTRLEDIAAPLSATDSSA